MHYYDRQGNPAYEIVGKNGKKRTPYKKEAKELGLVPGVTSISGQLEKEGLIQWMVNNTVNVCMDNPFCPMGSSKDDWIKKIKDKLKADSDRITGQGHAIHDALEMYYKTGKLSNEYKEYIIPVIALIEKTWPQLSRTEWQAERSFNFQGLYGGRVDISTEALGGIILDFKTKDSEDIKKFKAYEGHKQQLIAYAYGLDMPSAKCGNIFLSALKPNIVCLEMLEHLEVSWEKFKILLKYWHLEHYNQCIAITQP